jgi:hypothetical protein
MLELDRATPLKLGEEIANDVCDGRHTITPGPAHHLPMEVSELMKKLSLVERRSLPNDALRTTPLS